MAEKRARKKAGSNGSKNENGSGASNGNGAPPRVRRPGRGLPSEEGAAKGTLVIVGGREDKENEMIILRELARRVGRGKLVVATIGSEVPDELWEEYREIFARLGVKKIEHLSAANREELVAGQYEEILDGARCVFFTGGSQLRITSILGGTAACETIHELYRRGGIVAGTSAGAAMMSDTMLVEGPGDSSHLIGANLLLAPGLGFIGDVVIDQHFAERGRIGRLIGAVAQNPKTLGIGIDENTAVVVDDSSRFQVLGGGAVYVVDGFEVRFTNVADEDRERALSIFDLRLHVLSQGDVFDLVARRPEARPAEEVEKRAASVGR